MNNIDNSIDKSPQFLPSTLFDFRSDNLGKPQGAQELPEEFQRLVSPNMRISNPVPPGNPRNKISGGIRKYSFRSAREVRQDSGATAPIMSDVDPVFGGIASSASTLYGHLPKQAQQTVPLPSETPRNRNGNVLSKLRTRVAGAAHPETIGEPQMAGPIDGSVKSTISGWDGVRPAISAQDHSIKSPSTQSKQKPDKRRQPNSHVRNETLPDWRKIILENAPFDPRHQARAVVHFWECAHSKAIKAIKPLREGMGQFQDMISMVSIDDTVNILRMLADSFGTQKESVDAASLKLGEVVTVENREYGKLLDELRCTVGEWLDESKQHLRTICDGLENTNYRFQTLSYDLADKRERLLSTTAEVSRLGVIVSERDQTIIDITKKMKEKEKIFIEISRGKRLRTEAARTIQKRAKLILPRVRKYHVDRYKGALLIQKIFRGRAVRSLYRVALTAHRGRVRAADKLQREIRKFLKHTKNARARSAAKLQRKNAKKIQGAWRRKLAWKVYQERMQVRAVHMKKIEICTTLQALKEILHSSEAVLSHHKKRLPTVNSAKMQPDLDELLISAQNSVSLAEELHSAIVSQVDLQKSQLRQLQTIKDQRRADKMSKHNHEFENTPSSYHKNGSHSRATENISDKHAGYVPPESVAASENGLPANGLARVALDHYDSFESWENGSNGNVAGRDRSLAKGSHNEDASAVKVRNTLSSDLPGHTRPLEDIIKEQGESHDACLLQLSLQQRVINGESRKERVRAMSNLEHSEVLERAKTGLQVLKNTFDQHIKLGEAPNVHPAMKWLAALPCQALVKRITLYDAIKRKSGEFTPTWLRNFTKTIFKQLLPIILPEKLQRQTMPMRGGTSTPLSKAVVDAPIAPLGYIVPPGAMHHTMLIVHESGALGTVRPEWFPCGFVCHEPGRETHQQLLRSHGLPNIVDQIITDIGVFSDERSNEPESRLLAHIYRSEVCTPTMGFTLFLWSMLHELGFVYCRQGRLVDTEQIQTCRNITENAVEKNMLGAPDFSLVSDSNVRSDLIALGLCSDTDQDTDDDNDDDDCYAYDGGIAHITEVVDKTIGKHGEDHYRIKKTEGNNRGQVPLEQENITVLNALMVLAILFHVEPDEAVATAKLCEGCLLGGNDAGKQLTGFAQATFDLLLIARIVNVSLTGKVYGGLEYKVSSHSAIKDTFLAFRREAELNGPLAHTMHEVIPLSEFMLLCLREHDEQAFRLKVSSWCTHAFLVADSNYDGQINLSEFRSAAEPVLRYLEHSPGNSTDGKTYSSNTEGNEREHENSRIKVDFESLYEEAIYARGQARLLSLKNSAAMESKYASRTKNRCVRPMMDIEAFHDTMIKLWEMAPCGGLLAICKEQRKGQDIEI